MTRAALTLLLLLSLTCAHFGSSEIARADDKISPDLIRQVQLHWEEEDKAIAYEVELAMNPEFESPLYQQRVDGTKFNVDLLPGAYFYRVRGIDEENRPGRWTATQELNINARPPVLLSPPNGSLLKGNLLDTGIILEWRTSGPGIRYLVEVKIQGPDGQFTETVTKQEVSETTFAFFPQVPGKYQWSVHTLGAGGDEPGLPWELTVEGVIPRDYTPEPGVEPKRIVRYVPPWWRGHWTLFTRYGQTSLSYAIEDQDLRSRASFNGFTGLAAATLNYEWHDPVITKFQGVPWGEIDYEFDRQTVLFESVLLTRKAIRAGMWFDVNVGSGLRLSPILEYGMRTIAIYQPYEFKNGAATQTDASRAIRTNADRTWFAFGPAAEYSLKTYMKLGLQIKLRSETGGQAGVYNVGGNFNILRSAGNLKPDSGLEIIPSATLILSKKVQIQGRIRYEKYKAEWTGFFPTASGDQVTHAEFTDIGFDLGVGIKF